MAMGESAMAAAMTNQLMQAAKAVEEQVDAEIDRMENFEDEDYERIKNRRMEEMKKKAKQRDEWQTQGHGEYSEVANEKEFFAVCNKSKRVVAHFYRDSTPRCKIVDKHLEILARKHVETRFIKANVEKVPFLVTRLNIRVMPTIALVIDANTGDYIRGFDDLGGIDEFTTEMLEWRLGKGKAIHYAGDTTVPPSARPKPSILGRPNNKKTIRSNEQDSSDEDW